jgi:hypothetical protein
MVAPGELRGGRCGGRAAVIEVAAHQTLDTRSHDDVATTMWRHRRIIHVGLWLLFPTVVGLLAAAFDLVWIDVALTVYVFLSLLAGGLAYRVIRCRLSGNSCRIPTVLRPSRFPAER